MVDYLDLYTKCLMTSDSNQIAQIEHVVSLALLNQDLYQTVSKTSNIPWPLIAAIHFRESNQKFNCHLHNGDPLSARTVHAPAGRPLTGSAPFSWTESAIDALSEVWRPILWDIPSCLGFLEHYNGLGYQKHRVNTPYLWDFTDQYTSGLYASDGIFEPELKESRPGCVAILHYLEKGGISLDFSSMGPPKIEFV